VCSSDSAQLNSLHLHNDLPLRPAFFEIHQCLLRLIERKYLVNYRPDAARLEQFTDLGELPAGDCGVGATVLVCLGDETITTWRFAV